MRPLVAQEGNLDPRWEEGSSLWEPISCAGGLPRPVLTSTLVSRLTWGPDSLSVLAVLCLDGAGLLGSCSSTERGARRMRPLVPSPPQSAQVVPILPLCPAEAEPNLCNLNCLLDQLLSLGWEVHPRVRNLMGDTVRATRLKCLPDPWPKSGSSALTQEREYGSVVRAGLWSHPGSHLLLPSLAVQRHLLEPHPPPL